MIPTTNNAETSIEIQRPDGIALCLILKHEDELTSLDIATFAPPNEQGERRNLHHITLSTPEEIKALKALLALLPELADEEDEINGLFEAAMQEVNAFEVQSPYSQFLESVQDNEQYKYWLEHAHDPASAEDY